MSSVLHKLSKEIGIKEGQLVTAGVRAYIMSELGKIEAQLHALYHKYGIKSIKDLTRIDYLEAERAISIVLLGSMARGDYAESSDFDILIIDGNRQRSRDGNLTGEV